MTKRNTGRHTTKKKGSGVKGAVIALCAVVVVAAAGAAAGGYYVKGLDTIYPNVTVAGTDLGGMTKEQAAEALADSPYSDSSDSIRCTVSLPDKSRLEVSGRDVGLAMPAEKIADIAYEYGRDGGLFSNALTYLRCKKAETDLSAEMVGEIDEETLESIVLKSVYELEQQLVIRSLKDTF